MKTAIGSLTLITLLLATLIPSALAWEMEKTSMSYAYAERLQSNYSNGNASVGLGVAIESSIMWVAQDMHPMTETVTLWSFIKL